MLEITDRYLILLLQSYNSLIIILILIYLFFVQTNPDGHAHMCCVQNSTCASVLGGRVIINKYNDDDDYDDCIDLLWRILFHFR